MSFNANFLEQFSERKWYPVFLWGYSLFSGIFFAAALPPKFISGAEWLALAPFLGLLIFPMRRNRDLFFFGWLAGAAAVGFYLRWFFNAAPLVWLGISGYRLSIFLTAIGWFLPVGYFAFGFGLFLIIAKLIQVNAYSDILILPLFWGFLEYARTFLFSFHPLGYGAGTIAGGNMAFALLGYSLADYGSFRQLAVLGGGYFLSVVAAFPSVFIFVAVREYLNGGKDKFKNIFYSAVTIGVIMPSFFVLGNFLKGSFFHPAGSVNLALAEAGFFPEEWHEAGFQKKNKEVYSGLVKKAASTAPEPDIIVLPEGISLASSSTELLAKNKKEQILITDWPKEDEIAPKNTTAIIDNKKGVIGLYDKRFLMPYGEYLPYAIEWIAKLIGQDRWLSWNRGFRWYYPGGKPGIFRTGHGTIGVLSCSEIISPHLNTETAAVGAQIILYSASDAILRGSPVLHSQNIAMAKIRAVETRRAIAYVSNGEHSFAVGPLGDILAESRDFSPKVIFVKALLNDSKTIAVRLSDFAPLILGAAAFSIYMVRKNTA